MHDCVEENRQLASSFSGVLSFSTPGVRDEEERRTISIRKNTGNKVGQFAGLRKAGLTLQECMRTQNSVCCPY